VKISDYVKEIERYNECIQTYGDLGEGTFFSDVVKKYPEFEVLFRKSLDQKKNPRADLLEFLMENSDFLNRDENRWMKSIMQVVRKTSMFFQPQIRTKIMNEGWASYWHENLFLQDDRIKGHEVEFARINAGVTSMPRVGLNPYALGMKLFYYIEDMIGRGKYSFSFQRLSGADERRRFDEKTGEGKPFIFKVRENFCDFTFINTFVDQDFVTSNKLFVAGKRLNRAKMVWEYYVQSRKAEDYRRMLFDSLYHPPHIKLDQSKGKNALYLVHHFEGKPLVKEFIANTMLGIEYLWGGPVKLETSEVIAKPPAQRQFPVGGYSTQPKEEGKDENVTWRRVVYKMENRKLTKDAL
jgi:stage V sporulation protein R